MSKTKLTLALFISTLAVSCSPGVGEEYAQNMCDCWEASKDEPSMAEKCVEIAQEFSTMYGDDDDIVKEYTEAYNRCSGVTPPEEEE